MLEFDALTDTSNKLDEEVIRDYFNATFSLLKGLAVYDVNNEAIERPLNLFMESLEELRKTAPDNKGVVLKLSEGVISISNVKISKHFSIVEASKIVPECMDMAMIESFEILDSVTRVDIAEFFSKWSLHCSVMQKPKVLNFEPSNIKLVFSDPDKLDARLKTSKLMMSNKHAVYHHYLLLQHTKDFFEAVAGNSLPSQKDMRRELMEMVDIATVNPYQLVALSLIRAKRNTTEKFEAAACEAIATSLLAVLLSKELNFSSREQVNMGLVGLLYNIGLLNNELSEIISQDKALSPVEYRRVVEAHSRGVMKLIRSEGISRPNLSRLLAMFEASQGVQRQSVALTLESRLMRLVSTYVALTSDRPHRDAYIPTDAMKLLGNRATTKKEGNLDPVLYYLFVRIMGVYPVGSLVLLSDHTKAVVFRPNGEKVGVPMVKLLVDDEKDASRLIDLSTSGGLEIVKALNPRKEGVAVPGYFFE